MALQQCLDMPSSNPVSLDYFFLGAAFFPVFLAGAFVDVFFLAVGTDFTSVPVGLVIVEH
jgi:hypothetical protein